jgi:hypothetical protein
MAYAADSSRVGNGHGSNSLSLSRVPYADWIKLTKEQCDQLIATRNKERLARAGGSSKLFPPPRCANMHDVDAFVNLDQLIDYAALKLETNYDTDSTTNKDEGGAGILAYMAGQQSSCGDV